MRGTAGASEPESKLRQLVAAALVFLVFAACGKSRRDDQADARAGDAGEPTGGSATGGSGATGGSATGGSGASASDECVVVRRLGCCMEPYAVHASELIRDECLWPFDHLDVDGDRRDRCAATRPANCPAQPCTQPAPTSRETALDEEARCHLDDECADASDCTFAAQVCDCCACSEPTPARLVADTCLVAEDDPNPDPTGAVVCPSGFCLGCRHEMSVSCSPTPSGVRRCEWGPELAAEACSAERPCRGPFSGASCSAPGDPICGGPPPLPDDCSIDSDCAGAGDASICGELCSRRYCTPGCVANGDCLGAEICGTDHHCQPKACGSDDACGANFRCNDSGLCERRSCARTSNCEGYCVNGRCFDAPGTCRYPLP